MFDMQCDMHCSRSDRLAQSELLRVETCTVQSKGLKDDQLTVWVQVTGHCPSGQLQTITVFDPMPGNATGLVAAM